VGDPLALAEGVAKLANAAVFWTFETPLLSEGGSQANVCAKANRAA